ncbi:MAG: S1 RNA-binding domain-containing protein [Candidatus Woesearchaeota archaeon]
MYYRKKGFPQESELILCKVTKVQYHSVFVRLEEYDGNLSGMLHISEVSPGRIRNIRDYVKEGKVIVCKILSTDEKKGHIDVSLRRVNESQRKEKVESMKQEAKSEKILDFVADALKIDKKKFYTDVFAKVTNHYPFLHEAFIAYVAGEFDIKTLGLDKKVTDLLDDTIRQRIKPPKVEIKAKIKIECYDPSGVEKVKNMLVEIQGYDVEHSSVYYLGAGTYMFHIEGEEYKPLEDVYDKVEALLEKNISKTCICEIKRQ